MEEKKMIIGITHGDINGIGYEVILKTLLENHVVLFFVLLARTPIYFKFVLNRKVVVA